MESTPLSLTELLNKVGDMHGSDLHLTAGSAPRIRVHGEMLGLSLPVLKPPETKRLAYSVMTDDQKFRFEQALELDFSFGVKGLARFRANVFTQRGSRVRRLPHHPLQHTNL